MIKHGLQIDICKHRDAGPYWSEKAKYPPTARATSLLI